MGYYHRCVVVCSRSSATSQGLLQMQQQHHIKHKFIERHFIFSEIFPYQILGVQRCMSFVHPFLCGLNDFGGLVTLIDFSLDFI